MTRRLALLALVVLPPAAGVEVPPPAAIVCALSGRVRVVAPRAKPRDARLFEWLSAASVIEAAAQGRVVLAFRDGRRQELSAGARARLEPAGLVVERGAVRDLPPLPALADVLALAAEEGAGSRPGAVRVRGPRIRGLAPGGDAASLAGQTTLRFDPVRGAPRYRVEVRDAVGVLAYEAVTELPSVALPPDVLRPGMRYSWRVRTVDRPGPAAEGVESFRTLDQASVEARERLRRQVFDAGDPSAAALLAEVDRSLGLRRQTRGEPIDRAAARLP
jgi:hypothetical protein